MLTKANLTRLRSLKDKKHREELGLFAVEGEKVVSELLAAGHVFVEIYATDDWLTRNSGITADIQEISTDEMARISHFPTPSPVFAVAKINRQQLDPKTLNQGLTLALDGIQDAGNLGTLLRIADWFALDRVIASPDCADFYNSKVISASMGSFCRVPFFSTDVTKVLQGIKVPVLGCDLQGDNVHTLPRLKDAVIVIGSEGRGMSAATRTCISRFITIPRLGSAESLNAGIAAAIVCDNLLRSR